MSPTPARYDLAMADANWRERCRVHDQLTELFVDHALPPREGVPVKDRFWRQFRLAYLAIDRLHQVDAVLRQASVQ